MRKLGALFVLVSLAAQAGEVTVVRPAAFIGADSSYYVMLDGKLASDIESKEHVRFTVTPGRHVLAVRCPKPMYGTYAEAASERTFGSEAAFFVIEPKFDCVTITAVEAKAAAPLLANTHLRSADAPSSYVEGEVERAASPAPAPSAAVVASEAPPKDEVEAATVAWIDAFNSRDPARILALYEPDAVLVGTTAKKAVAGTAAIGAYFRQAAGDATARVALGEHMARVYGDMAIDTGLYNFFQVRDGKATLVPARYTFVYRKRDGKWRIVEHHSSRVP